MTRNTRLESENRELWGQRAGGYDKLQWAVHEGYLAAFVEAGHFGPDDYVLDVGTGTGIIPAALASGCHKIVGVDLSGDMLAQARQKHVGNRNCFFAEADVRALPYTDQTFSRVTARMVFHHVVDAIETAVAECFRVLKPGGVMVLSEGVPPHIRVKEQYQEIFKLKEDRLTFYEADLEQLLMRGGFQDITCSTYVEPQVSVGNWLRNSGLPDDTQAAIMRLHSEADDFFKSAYHMEETADDCLIDMKFAIVTGKKP